MPAEQETKSAPLRPPPLPRPPPPDLTFRGTQTNTAQYVGENGDENENLYGDDDNFYTFSNTTLLQAMSRPFDGSVRLNAVWFHNPPLRVSPDEFIWGPGAANYTLLNYHNDYRVERISGTIKHKYFKITAGDFYVTYGRGLILSVVKADADNEDNTLRGARIEHWVPVPGDLTLIFVSGLVNTINVDLLTHQILEDDPDDWITGLRVELDPMDELSLGAHGVWVEPRFTDEADIDPDRNFVDQGTGVRSIAGGANADIRAGDFSMYLEANAQIHDNFRPAGEGKDILKEPGYVGFAEISYDISSLNLKGQGFYYHRWLMEGPNRGSTTDINSGQPVMYNKRISLGPTWLPVKSIGNYFGGKLTADLYLSRTRTQITLANTVLKYNGGITPLGSWVESEGTMIEQPVLTLRQDIGDSGVRITAEGGYLWEIELIDEQRRGRLWHTLADLAIPITGPHGTSLRFELRRHDLNTESGAGYWVALAKGTYNWSGVLGFDALYEYSDQTPGVDARLWGWLIPLERMHYLKGTLSYYAPAPLDGLTLKLSGGSQRGGRKCTGGGCRQYPNSVGVKLETVYRF